ncbi:MULTISPECIES: hypothetical protein [unclassified Shewanella]|jgi:uncharacterized protein YhaN|uniref:hypothetical protein n=1 Tax=Shewanella TaxID=22 RepID=UPI0021D8FCB5|nr:MULTISPECIES: hypothetical protein [unclassified Shewanella]MCU8015235.1 hypothetical protein [Shewanella sp. SM74]MCU8030200.1 hypothetical protein [Shewanella sp. SM73]
MEAAIFGFVGALIGAVLGFIGSILSTFGKSKDVQLDVRTKVVTNERAQWRKDMRELSAEYVALSNRVAVAPRENDEYELERTRVLIRLRLNVNPDHKLDAKLLLVLPVISQNARTKNINDLKSKLEEFETDMQALLKREWDKSKGEAETGNIAASDSRAA